MKGSECDYENECRRKGRGTKTYDEMENRALWRNGTRFIITSIPGTERIKIIIITY